MATDDLGRAVPLVSEDEEDRRLMPLSYAEAVAQVTGPGQVLEVAPREIDGVAYRAFVNAPASLRDLFGAARGFGDRTYLVYEDERWSFAEVMAAVDALASALVGELGVVRGDRVAIGMRNYPEWVISFAAVTSVGAVSVSLNAWWSADELDFALNDCGAKVLIADSERARVTADSCRRLDVTTVVVRAGGAELPAGAHRWDDLVRPGDSVMPDVVVGAEDDATILYTSGTTGRPKGAVSTHRAVLQSVMGFACHTVVSDLVNAAPAESGTAGSGSAGSGSAGSGSAGSGSAGSGSAGSGPATPEPEPEPAFILIVPLFHVTGSVPVMLTTFAFGVKLVMMYRWSAERALELIERERVTAFVGVPTQSWDLLESPRFADFDTSSLRLIGGGGAPAPTPLVRRVASSFAAGRPSLGYGLTETNAYGPANTGADYVTHPASTGRAGPILDIEIRDPLGHPVPTSGSGEIWLKSPTLIRGYWNRPEATAETIVDGWLRTGDLGRLDADGFLYIEDRAKDVILRGGENVYSAEVESVLYEHPAVYEAAVFGLPHPRLGEEVAATVVTKPGFLATPEELAAHVASRLATFKVPTRMFLIADPLPRNAAGKVLKRDLRMSYSELPEAPS
jgi:long-chain acyl-CoA synthetase